VSALAQVIQRSVVEMAPMVRLASGASKGIPPEALARAASVLTEVQGSYDDLFSAAERLFGSAARLKRALPGGTG
jgi:hypothetical protein